MAQSQYKSGVITFIYDIWKATTFHWPNQRKQCKYTKEHQENMTLRTEKGTITL